LLEVYRIWIQFVDTSVTNSTTHQRKKSKTWRIRWPSLLCTKGDLPHQSFLLLHAHQEMLTETNLESRLCPPLHCAEQI